MGSLGSGRSEFGLEGVRYGDAPSLLLVSGNDAARERGRRASAAAGLRIVAEAAPGEASVALGRLAAADAILADVDAGQTADLVPALDTAAQRGCRSLIAVRGDPAGTTLPLSTRVRLLADPSGLDILVGLHQAAAPETLRFHDVKNAESPRLQQLSAEVGRIANILATLSEDEAVEETNGLIKPRVDSALVRAIIRARRLRDHYFRSELFADPAWDMLLDLYAARLDRQRVAVSSLCIAAAVPATTALRWIKSLTDQRLFVRVADPQDGRRVFIELSDEAAAGLEAYLVAAQRISPIIL